jgi:hypothetical protein
MSGRKGQPGGMIECRARGTDGVASRRSATIAGEQAV